MRSIRDFDEWSKKIDRSMCAHAKLVEAMQSIGGFNLRNPPEKFGNEFDFCLYSVESTWLGHKTYCLEITETEIERLTSEQLRAWAEKQIADKLPVFSGKR